MIPVHKETIQFLQQLNKNNATDRMKENKPTYLEAKKNAEEVFQEIIGRLNEFVPLGDLQAKECMYRINRDMRYVKDDEWPYKPWFSATIWPQWKKTQWASYHVKIQPWGKSYVSWWFCCYSWAELWRIRDKIADDPQPLLDFLSSKSYTEDFGESLQGDALKNVPRWYDKEHPAADLLKYKSMTISTNLSDKTIVSDEYVDEVIMLCKKLQPFVWYFSNLDS